jgi:hypothetical protein
MSATVRPDNVKAALDAKLAAALAQLGEVREMEQPRLTPHLSPREIVAAVLLYAGGVFPVASTFGKAHAGELQFDAWYGQWLAKLSDADRGLWKQLRDHRIQHEHGHGAELIDVEISVAAESSVAVQPSSSGARPDVRKRLVRFAAHPTRAASAVCADYVRLARLFVHDFVRDHSRFLR